MTSKNVEENIIASFVKSSHDMFFFLKKSFPMENKYFVIPNLNKLNINKISVSSIKVYGRHIIGNVHIIVIALLLHVWANCAL